jgi:lysyl-tRNA synthetase class 2
MSSPYSDPLIQERIRKVEEIKNLGIDPYAKKAFAVSHHSTQVLNLCKESEEQYVKDLEEIKGNNPPLRGGRSEATGGVERKDNEEVTSPQPPSKRGEEVSLAGRIVLYRSMGKLAFAHLQDMKGRIQVCFQKDQFSIEGLNPEEKSPAKFVEKLCDLGDFIGVRGEMFRTNHGELTLFVKEMVFLSKSLRPMPEKFHGVTDRETMYRERNLDMMSHQETLSRFELRSKMLQELRDFFHEKEFLEIETPILQNQAGGAMAKVFETHHNALDQEMVLRIASELDNKRAVGGGMERVFEVAKDFRNEGTDPSHLQEFTMIEWYAAYCDINDNKRWTEEFFHRLAKNVFQKDVFIVRDTEGNETEIDFGKKFGEERFPDLLKKYANLDMFSATDDEVRACAKRVGVDEIEGIGRANLLDDIYKKTARCKLIQPTFVYDYPEELKPLAAPNGDGTASCFQLVVNTWEIVNSYGELIDPQVQRKLLEEQSEAKAGGDDEAMEVDEVFLKAMEHGFPPMTGSGFGIDRLMAIFSGQPNLRDVVLFPTMKPEGQKQKKLETNLAVAIINTDLVSEDWQALNAVGHLTAAYGARSGKNLFYQDHIETKDGEKLPLNTTHAIMIKQSNNPKLLELVAEAKKLEIHFETFTKEMLESSDDKKVSEVTRGKELSEIEFFGVLVYGKKSHIEKLTEKFPLLSKLGNSSTDNGDEGGSVGENSADFEIFSGEFNREKAWKMIESRCDFALQRHLAHVGASMEALAVHFGEEEKKEDWYLAGVLHDIDWNQTIEDEEKHCGEETMQYLKANGVSDEIAEAIQSHHPIFGVEIDTPMKKALFACDELSGFSVAVALMRPTKMMGMNAKSVTKKLKDKAFAAAVSREDMKTCEEYFDIPVSEFLQILIPAWEKIAGDWELK